MADENYGFIMADEEIDQLQPPLKVNSDIFDYEYHPPEIDFSMLLKESTVLLSQEEFQIKVQQLLQMEPKKSILKPWKKIDFDKCFTDQDINYLTEIKRSNVKAVDKKTGLKDCHTYKENGHYYIDYRHLWKNTRKNAFEAQKELKTTVFEAGKQLNEMYDEVWENSISKQLNDIFIEKFKYQDKAATFLENANRQREVIEKTRRDHFKKLNRYDKKNNAASKGETESNGRLLDDKKGRNEHATSVPVLVEQQNAMFEKLRARKKGKLMSSESARSSAGLCNMPSTSSSFDASEPCSSTSLRSGSIFTAKKDFCKRAAVLFLDPIAPQNSKQNERESRKRLKSLDGSSPVKVVFDQPKKSKSR